MSRIGKLPIKIPKGVQVSCADGKVLVEGPKGKLTKMLPPEVRVDVTGDQAIVVSTSADSRVSSRNSGLLRSLVQNMVTGVTEGYRKTLELVGVGYRADVQGRNLVLTVGLSHPVNYLLPEGVSAKVEEKQTRIIIDGSDKELIGQTAAVIHRFRQPEPYKGKGIRFSGVPVRQKAGKTGVKA